MLTVRRYTPGDAATWDEFVNRSKNGLFLFRRGYMDYHADRFRDHSLLFAEDGKPVALLPACEREGGLASHAGLTFGGVVSDERMRTPLMVELFATLRSYLNEHGLARLTYKAVPHIYHSVPAEEDLYALFVHGGRLVRRDVTSALRPMAHPPVTKGRRYSTNKARKHGVMVRESRDFAAFMALEERQLQQKYGVRPVHTAAELELLAGRFPENIRLFVAEQEGDLLGGTVVYDGGRVAHTQYIATSERGRELGALDCVVDALVTATFVARPYFDFGISTEDGGRTLNVGLIGNKESYGARAVAHDFYELAAA